MKRLLCALLFLMWATLAQAAQPRFDEVVFFQTEQAMLQKEVKFDEVARFSRKLQSNIWNALKKAKLPVGNGYVVIAVRSDGQVGAWLDMEPALHEYYENEVLQAAMKTPPFFVAEGSVVFGLKMAIDTPKHTSKAKPDPKEWQAARKKLGNTADIEAVVQAAWPE
ncbi:hypothetical protein [Undibacterium sp.]|uniref:hypothetical protein n=1 Tax=Undibacterium sp. TaxID=1914977 RepID=UPI0025E0BFD7|nr:hypothetical protein [Undibacterium sp.]